MNANSRTPPSEMASGPSRTSTAPPCPVNRLSTDTTATIASRGATERAARPAGTPETRYSATTEAARTPSAAKSRAASAMTMNAMPPSSLVRGSSRYRGPDPG